MNIVKQQTIAEVQFDLTEFAGSILGADTLDRVILVDALRHTDTRRR